MSDFIAAAEPAILALGTAVPRYKLDQQSVGAWMAAGFADEPAAARMIRAVHAQSGIETRHACIPDFGKVDPASRFTLGGDLASSATTSERMAIYQRESVPLAVGAAKRAIAQLAEERQVDRAEITALVTHVIAVSCTGFFAPGLDFALTKALQLNPTVDRQLIGFMGCAAAFNGLRVATQAVRSNPNALALVVCVELASLHSYPNSTRDAILAASLFADGAGAALVGRPTTADKRYFLLQQFHSCIKPETEEEMAWQIGDHGFALRLSPRIPAHLAEVAPAALTRLFTNRLPDFWAIHPGGRAIVERLAEIFALTPAQTAATFEVLRDYGNMSSATILFVLQALQTRWWSGKGSTAVSSLQQSGVAMAFGPGLVIEMARLSYVDNRIGQRNGLHHRQENHAVGLFAGAPDRE